MKKLKEKGITLVALVVTIIILLILAGVALRLALSENGLIKMAMQSGETARDALEEEKVKLAVSGAFLDGTGTLTKANVQKALENEFGTLEEGQLEGGAAGPWTFKGDRKTYTIGNGGDIQELKPKTVADLKAGDWVIYESSQGSMPCRVLYDTEYNTTNKTDYGIQIISSNIVSDVTLGETDPYANPDRVELDNKRTESWYQDRYRGIDSYNNAIQTLNKEASKYINSNTNFVAEARCVGSVPNDPNSESELTTHSSTDEDCQFKNGKYRKGDNNYETDWEQMNNISDSLATVDPAKKYWMASRVEHDGDEYGLYVADGFCSDELYYEDLFHMQCDLENAYSKTFGLRPVFKLKDGVKLVDGDGSMNNPYKMG